MPAALLALLACARSPAPLAPPPADDLLYFVMVDRFADGDPRNNGAVDRADPAAFHGGDLDGLIAHLDYLEGLGVKTLWISPVFEMREDKLDGHGAFHGYWVTDPGRVAARFGSARDLRRLSRELERRHMRLVLDVVWNHVGYDATLTTQRPGWFHGQGDIQNWDNALERVQGDVHGLPDLAQENEQVYGWLLRHSETWLRVARPSGFRIDAVRHMPLTFQARIAEDLRASGGDELWLLGEAFEGDPAKLAKIHQGGGFSSVFDFPLHYAMVDVFCKDASPGRLASILSQDRFYGPALVQSPGALVTFLDNHDTSRILSACGGETSRVEAALLFQMSVRGTPSITWGTEVGLTGAGEPDNRADMRFDPQAPLAETLRTLSALRGAHPALRSGLATPLFLDEVRYTQVRLSPDEVAVLTVNRGTAAAPLDLGALGTVPATATVVEGAPPKVVSMAGPPSSAPVGVQVVILTAKTPGAFQPWVDSARAPPASRELRLQVDPLPLVEDERAVWVGADPALGSWDPAKGAPVEGGTATVTVPVGAVVASKLVILRADGSVSWEAGADRYTVVTAGEGPQVERAGWRGP